MTSYRHSSVVDKDTARPANSGHVHNLQACDNQHIDCIDSLSSHRWSERCRKANTCKYHLGRDNGTCRDRPFIVARLLSLEISFWHVNHLDEKRRHSVVPDHISNRSESRSRIKMNGKAVAGVKDLNCPSKNGTSRPLRPPCQ
jgi:hypothetical protein